MANAAGRVRCIAEVTRNDMNVKVKDGLSGRLSSIDADIVAIRRVLLVEGLEDLNLHLASRNRPEIKMLDATSLNAYEVLNHRWIVASEPAVKSLAEVLS